MFSFLNLMIALMSPNTLYFYSKEFYNQKVKFQSNSSQFNNIDYCPINK